MPTVRDIMATEIVTIGPGAPIHQAVDILLDKRISGLPVVDEAGRLVGILTEFALLAIAYDERVSGDTVAQHMTTDVLTVDVDDPISKVADLCIVHRVRRVPVLQDGKLAGLVARRDVLQAMYSPKSVASTK
ncbi:MAG: CBS domain-containing protein [Planctomycetaceae bacterium]|nr:CBS domain-containing protein [Planctomycetaceae bacterium]